MGGIMLSNPTDSSPAQPADDVKPSTPVRLADQEIAQEIALAERFADTYGRLFEQLIAKLNANPADADPQTLRLCVEAISMVLSFQGNFAQLLADLTRAR